jgi:EmrB/QacA subfamily drug resistance transporter
MTEMQRRLAGLACLATIILAILDANIVTAAAVPIVRDLDPGHGVARLPWLITAYGLAATAALPLYGKLCDTVGPKPVFLAAVATFLAGSALCGAARTMTELIVFRGLQGLGGGGLMAVTMVVLAHLAPPEQRARKGGIGGVVAGVALVAGPIIGGLLADHLGWRWIFFVNLPLGIAVLAVSATALRLPPRHRRGRIDVPGVLLAGACAVTLCLLLEWGGDRYAWTSRPCTVLAALTVALLAAFLVREATAAEPVLPLRLFSTPVLRVALPLQLFIAVAMTGAIVYVMVYLQVARGVAADRAGLWMIPLAVGMTVAGTLVGRLVGRGIRLDTFMISGTGLGALALALLGLLRAGSPPALPATALLAYGLGLGQVLGVLVMLVQNAAPAHQLGVATTALRLFQSLGGALGAAVFGAVLTHAFAARYPGAGRSGLASVPPADQARALDAFTGSLDVVFLSAAGVMALATVLAVLLRSGTGLARTRPTTVDPHAEPEPANA